MGRGGGFSTDRLLTDASLIEDFFCPICTSLVETPVITACSHVFCRTCWEEWMSREHVSSRCPKCNRIFAGVGAAADSCPPCVDLREGNPLAWRILSRVQVRCPVNGCPWTGDYSELSPHLTASDSHTGAAASSGGGGASALRAKEDAEAMKAQGNARFEARSFQEAIKLYSKAITLDPSQPSFYANRAAAWLMIGAPAECLKDCERALELDPAHVRSHLRVAKALLDLGKLGEAVQHLSGAAAVVPGSHELANELVRVHGLSDKFEAAVAAYEGREVAAGGGGEGRAAGGGLLPEAIPKHKKVEKNYPLALRLLQQVESEAPSVCMQIWVARAAVMCAKCDLAITLTLRILKANKQNIDALHLRGRALFFSGDVVNGVKHLREILRLDPDRKDIAHDLKMMRAVDEALKSAADSSLNRRFEEQVSTITEVLSMTEYPVGVPILASLYSSRAQARLRLQQHEAVLEDSAAALRIRDDCKDAWIARASALMAVDREGEARDELAALLNGMYQNDSLVRHWYDKADMLVRKKVRPDYYAILKVSPIAVEMEIKNAYRARALECHPDKVSGQGEDAVKQAEQSFKLLGEALEVLGDAQMRALYDQGYDKQAIDERMEAVKRAARGDSRGHGHHH